MGVHGHQKTKPAGRSGSSGTRPSGGSSCFYFYIRRPGVRAGVHQDLHLLPVSGQGLAERARVGQTPGPPSTDRLHRAGQRVRRLRRPGRLQAICDRFGPADIQAFFDRWITRIPTPLTPADRAAGYWWELSMRQVEVSRTLVFDDPRRARGFFESLVADNIGVGRPDEVRAVFAARTAKADPKDPSDPSVHARHRSEDGLRLQAFPGQAIPQGRESPSYRDRHQQTQDIGVLSRLEHLPELVAKARQVNDRLLMIERAGQGCAIGSALFERTHQPYIREGQRTGALRFGDTRAMALTGALCCVIHAVTGFTNQSLRGLVAGLLGTAYTTNQMTYDLRRLRLHGLIERHPHTNTYTLTPEGLRVADLLHQAPRPPPATPPRSRQTTRTPRDSPRPDHHRPRPHRLHHQRPPRTAA